MTHRERPVPERLLAAGLLDRGWAEPFTPAGSEGRERRVYQRTVELRSVKEGLRRKLRGLEEVSAARQQSEGHMRLVTDALPVAIAYVDEGRVLRFVNRR